MSLPNVDGYSYYINANDSDEDAWGGNSSDEENLDEVDVFLYGTSKQKHKALKNLTGDEASSDEDFEKVMNAELDHKVKAIENNWKSLPHQSENCMNPGHKRSSEASSSSKPPFYDDIYFDSDEEDTSKRKRLTDDELFYDPNADDEDQKWADKKHRRVKKKTNKTNDHTTLNSSDAVLSCPACMTTLCMDCQRHSLYQNQFRAMFVVNCNVQFDEVLHYKEKRKREFRRHKKRSHKSCQEVAASLAANSIGSRDGLSSDASYHPVKCKVCQTEVAVYDNDEVYHFFNTLTGHA